MNEQTTCGKGLAENSALPAKLGELASALADNLEAHMKTLEISDQDARREHDTYARLAQEFRRAAVELESATAEMAAARAQPMGKHHTDATSVSEALKAFETLVRVKRELMTLLTSSADGDQRMLVRMAAASQDVETLKSEWTS